MWKLLVLLAGCSYAPTAGVLAGDGAVATDGMVDADGNTTGDADGPISTTGFRRRIDIANSVVGTHENFPLLVALEDGQLRTTGNGGHVASADGSDIRFSLDADGMQPLVRELERFDAATGQLTAWVGVPSLSSATVLYVHYGDANVLAAGDPKTIWTTAQFASVWHLTANGDAAGTSATFNVSGATDAAGQAARGRRFDGMNDSINVGSATGIEEIWNGGGTVETWLFANTTGENGAGRLLEKGSWLITFGNGALRFFHDWSNGDGDWQTPAVTLGQWHHLAVVYARGTTAALYLDGVDVTNQTQVPSGAALADDNAPLLLGNRAAEDRTFDGILDEVRMSTVSRDAGWIAVSHANQRDPSAFYEVGSEEPR